MRVEVVASTAPQILETQYNQTVEDGYIGGYYLKTSNPINIREVGIEYYSSNTNTLSTNPTWEKQTLPLQTDGEYAGFILPKTKYTYVRGYIIDITGRKTLTNSTGHQISTGNPLISYYNTGGGSNIANAGENEGTHGDVGEGVEINAVPFIIVGVVGIVNAGLTIHDTYTTIRDCHSEGYFTLNCTVNLGLSIIPVKGGKQAKNVIEFAGQTKKHGGDVRKIERLVHTNKTAREAAINLGYTEIKDYPFNSHGSIVFKKGSEYITPDNTSHNYDYAWKVFDSKGNRTGTAIVENGILVIKKN